MTPLTAITDAASWAPGFRGRWLPSNDERQLAHDMKARGAGWNAIARALGRPEPDVRAKLDLTYDNAASAAVRRPAPRARKNRLMLTMGSAGNKQPRRMGCNSLAFRVLQALAAFGTQGAAQLADRLSENRRSLTKRCGDLRALGLVDTGKSGTHSITPAGKAAMREIQVGETT